MCYNRSVVQFPLVEGGNFSTHNLFAWLNCISRGDTKRTINAPPNEKVGRFCHFCAFFPTELNKDSCKNILPAHLWRDLWYMYVRTYISARVIPGLASLIHPLHRKSYSRMECKNDRPKKRGRYGRFLMDSDPLATIPRATKQRLRICDLPHENPGNATYSSNTIHYLV